MLIHCVYWYIQLRSQLYNLHMIKQAEIITHNNNGVIR